MAREHIGTVFIVFGVIFFSIFLGVFFGRLYPEIVINKDSIKTSCLITNSTIDSFYCPSTSCTSCTDSAGLNSCSDVDNYMKSFDPTKCSLNNTQNCPISPQMCSNGYKCCATCCQTCTSCTTSCSGSGRNVIPQDQSYPAINSHSWNAFSSANQTCNIYSKGDHYEGDIKQANDECLNRDNFQSEGCTQTCHSYPCNCYCCQSVSNLLCSITADVCYNADLPSIMIR